MTLAFGLCVSAMHMEWPQLQPLQAYPSKAARMQPLSCVQREVSPSGDYQTDELPDDNIQPLRSTWPSARKMSSKMSQKLQQHKEDLEPPAETGDGLRSLATKRKVFWASQLRKQPKGETKAKRVSAEEAIAWKVKETLALSTIALALDHRARQASDSDSKQELYVGTFHPNSHTMCMHHIQAAADAKAELSAAEAAAICTAEAAAAAATVAQGAVAAQQAAAAQCLEEDAWAQECKRG